MSGAQNKYKLGYFWTARAAATPIRRSLLGTLSCSALLVLDKRQANPRHDEEEYGEAKQDGQVHPLACVVQAIVPVRVEMYMCVWRGKKARLHGASCTVEWKNNAAQKHSTLSTRDKTVDQWG